MKKSRGRAKAHVYIVMMDEVKGRHIVQKIKGVYFDKDRAENHADLLGYQIGNPDNLWVMEFSVRDSMATFHGCFCKA